MHRLFIVVFVAALAMACDTPRFAGNIPPSTVTPTAPTLIPPRQVATYTIAGSVRGRGTGPLGGARIVAVDQSIGPSVTDATGRYELSGVHGEPVRFLGPLLSAAYPGYFTDVRFADASYAPLTRDAQLDFELEPIVKISVGDVVHGRVPVGERVCSHWGYGASACERVAVVAPVSGSMQVTIAGPNLGFDFDVVGPEGTFLMYGSTTASPSRFVFTVQAGSLSELRVIGAGQPRDFELTTVIR